MIFTNANDGIKAEVFARADGKFDVLFSDTDAGVMVSRTNGFANEGAAVKAAREFVGEISGGNGFVSVPL